MVGKPEKVREKMAQIIQVMGSRESRRGREELKGGSCLMPPDFSMMDVKVMELL